jgi:hypothetical protein
MHLPGRGLVLDDRVRHCARGVGDESTSVGLGLPITSFEGREKQRTGKYSGKRGRVREGVRDVGRRKLSAWWGRALLFSGTEA